MPDETVELTNADLATVAVEVWRLSSLFPDDDRRSSSAAARYSIRKLAKVVADAACEYVDLTGREYDVGMAVEVLDTEGLADQGVRVVKEMLSPVVLLRGKALAQGQVVLEWKPVTNEAPVNTESTEGGSPADGHDQLRD